MVKRVKEQVFKPENRWFAKYILPGDGTVRKIDWRTKTDDTISLEDALVLRQSVNGSITVDTGDKMVAFLGLSHKQLSKFQGALIKEMIRAYPHYDEHGVIKKGFNQTEKGQFYLSRDGRVIRKRERGQRGSWNKKTSDKTGSSQTSDTAIKKTATPSSNPEENARRVIQQPKRPRHTFIVAAGALYVKKGLTGMFRSSNGYEEHDLESANIEADHTAGTVIVDTGTAKIICDGLKGLSLELESALRIERAKAYPNSLQTKQDKRNYPNLRWEEPD